MFKFYVLLCCYACISLSSIAIYSQQISSKRTTQQIALGSVGLDKDFMLQKGFNSVALPTYKEPIKVSVLAVAFTKSRFKTFMEANKRQSANVTLVDSITKNLMFVQLDIADNITLINALNQSENSHVKTYLRNNKQANILTTISIAFNQKDFDAIMNADAVFLVESSPKTYALQLYKDGQKTELVKFNQGTVFGFDISNCCWQENEKRQLNIVDLITDYRNCPNNTYKSANRAKQKVNYFKF